MRRGRFPTRAHFHYFHQNHHRGGLTFALKMHPKHANEKREPFRFPSEGGRGGRHHAMFWEGKWLSNRTTPTLAEIKPFLGDKMFEILFTFLRHRQPLDWPARLPQVLLQDLLQRQAVLGMRKVRKMRQRANKVKAKTRHFQ